MALAHHNTGPDITSGVLHSFVIPVIYAVVTVSTRYGVHQINRYWKNTRTIVPGHEDTDENDTNNEGRRAIHAGSVDLPLHEPTNSTVIPDDGDHDGVGHTDDDEGVRRKRTIGPPETTAVPESVEVSTEEDTITTDSTQASSLAEYDERKQRRTYHHHHHHGHTHRRHKQQISPSGHSYLEHCSLSLFQKASGADHLDKVGIGEALFELGELAYGREQHNVAIRILERAARVQRRVLKESALFTAAAMSEHGQLLVVEGRAQRGHVYLDAAARLKANPNETGIHDAWEMHIAECARDSSQHQQQQQQQHRQDDTDEHDDADDIQGQTSFDTTGVGTSNKLLRRLKRSRNEHLPLAHTLRVLESCREKMNRAVME